jgi:hypothetical protein
MTEDIATRLRQALHADAARVEPSNALGAIRSRTAPPRPTQQRRGWIVGVATAGLAAAATIVGVSVLADRGTTPSPDVAEQPTGQVEMARVKVYYLGLAQGRYRLFMEVRHLPAPEGKAVAAVRAALRRKPLDPDYLRPWYGTDVTSVSWERDVIAVDLTGEVDSFLANEDLDINVQQLVYTAQAALGSTRPVRFTLDGEPINALMGAPADEPIERGNPLVVRAMVQITSPAEGAVVDSPVTVRGVASVFEANVNWDVVQDGRVVKSGFTMTREAYKFSPFEERIALPPGDYTLRFCESSAEDGRRTHMDTKRITVR